MWIPSTLTVALFLAGWPAASGPPPVELSCLARHYPVKPVFENGQWAAALPDGSRIPVLPVNMADQDPGRVRIEAIMAATYGGDGVAAQQLRVRFLGNPVRVHRKIAPALARVEQRLVQARVADARLSPFLRRLSGGFAQRKIAGTDRTSAHAFGIAVDLDSSANRRSAPAGKSHIRRAVGRASRFLLRYPALARNSKHVRDTNGTRDDSHPA